MAALISERALFVAQTAITSVPKKRAKAQKAFTLQKRRKSHDGGSSPSGGSVRCHDQIRLRQLDAKKAQMIATFHILNTFNVVIVIIEVVFEMRPNPPRRSWPLPRGI